MSRSFRLALWLQGVALVAPVAASSYWTVTTTLNPPVCSAEHCINMWPAFWVLTLILFFAPFVIVDCARKGRALLSEELVWLLGANVYVLLVTAALVGFWWAATIVDVLAVIVVLPTIVTTMLAIAWWRVKPDDVRIGPGLPPRRV